MTQHLGIDLGVTNLKWAVVEQDNGAWQILAHDQSPTLSAEGPEAVIGRLIDLARRSIEAWPAVESIGLGVPGLYDPARGATTFLVNMPGAWRDRPVGPPVEAALGLPTALINDARAFGLAELRLGAARGANPWSG